MNGQGYVLANLRDQMDAREREIVELQVRVEGLKIRYGFANHDRKYWRNAKFRDMSYWFCTFFVSGILIGVVIGWWFL